MDPIGLRLGDSCYMNPVRGFRGDIYDLRHGWVGYFGGMSRSVLGVCLTSVSTANSFARPLLRRFWFLACGSFDSPPGCKGNEVIQATTSDWGPTHGHRFVDFIG